VVNTFAKYPLHLLAIEPSIRPTPFDPLLMIQIKFEATFREITCSVVLNVKRTTKFLCPKARVFSQYSLQALPRLVYKFPAIYRTRKFITAFTTACDLSLYSARSIRPVPPHLSHTFILILAFLSMRRFSKWSLSSYRSM